MRCRRVWNSSFRFLRVRQDWESTSGINRYNALGCLLPRAYCTAQSNIPTASSWRAMPTEEDGAALEALSPVFSAERVRASPHSLYLAVSSSYRLTVLDAKTLRMLHLFSCMDAIEHIEWSCDSKFIVCGIFARGLAQVWSAGCAWSGYCTN